jgi:large subunit ribosomal protein L29
MDATELRNKSSDDLTEELTNLRREQFNLRMQQATGQLARSDQYRRVRKDIARVKTVMREQEKQQIKIKAKAGS